MCEIETSLINPIFDDANVLNQLEMALANKKDCTLNGICLRHEPFVHMKISNAFNEDLLEMIIHELKSVPYDKKHTDLYQFEQADNLASFVEPGISKIRVLLYEKVRPWLSSIFDIKLNNRMHLSSSRYQCADRLLCHDDLVGERIEGRKIAFILYLVPQDWNENDGGFLNLFDSNEKDEPISISTSYLPKFNELILFLVSPRSHHEVSEILSATKCRLSIHGWFHGPLNTEVPVLRDHRALPKFALSQFEGSEFLDVVNIDYINPDFQSQVQYQFQLDGEIMLTNFLLEEFYNRVENEIKSNGMKWTLRTPFNKRCYDVALTDNLPDNVRRLWDLFSSESMLVTLTNLCGVSLSTEDCNLKCQMELRRLKAGSYSLLFDKKENDIHFDTCFLYLTMYFDCKDWTGDYGGNTSFICTDSSIEVLKMDPQYNSLFLVEQKKKLLPFIEYVNHRIFKMNENGMFYQFVMSFHNE